MSSPNSNQAWDDAPAEPLTAGQRMKHVRYCSPFAAELLDRHPAWADDLDHHRPPTREDLAEAIQQHGLDAGLRHFRNHHMLRLVWRDLCGLAGLDEIFRDLTRLAETCLAAAIDGNNAILQEKHGVPVNTEGREQNLAVLGLGKLGGVELNLSSDIDVIFCYGGSGECRGGSKRPLSNEQYFTRLVRAVISSLSDVTGQGFCFRVDTRLRPFGDSGPLCPSLAAMEQYYQREGRDWERYALIKARPVAGDPELGKLLMDLVRPFVYRRYIDFTAVEALQDMHSQVSDDARRTDRLDDIKRGPGGIREIEFLAQCFQLLRGGREPRLQTSSLHEALSAIEKLGLLDGPTISSTRRDYVFLRRMENRIQAQHDQQTHRLPGGEDLQRLVRAMDERDSASLQTSLERVRESVQQRFLSIFPSQGVPAADAHWVEAWRQLQADRLAGSTDTAGPEGQPVAIFLRQLERMTLSHRAQHRLDQFMPVLLHRLDRLDLQDSTLHRIFDLVSAICQRSPYLVLLMQNPPALDRMIELFARSEWLASSVIRFPALLDELIDPSVGQQIPGRAELKQSVSRLMSSGQETETKLSGLNYLKLATTLRIAVAQLDGRLDSREVEVALASLAAALLQGVLELAAEEIEARHGRVAMPAEAANGSANSLAVIAYGSLGAEETGYDSDLDIVFLFDSSDGSSDGIRSLPAERYYARLAQRLLSLLTVMTPSGRLYPVDTRLRPNGRAGSLVSSLAAFAEYQASEAWTWELQALTRARFVAGNPASGAVFDRIRKDALQRPRDLARLRRDIAEMRSRMAQEHAGKSPAQPGPKHQPGGLVDIEFIVQFGVLATAPHHPDVLHHTSTLNLLEALVNASWLDPGDARTLGRTAEGLQQQRLLQTLVPAEQTQVIDCTASATIFDRLLGGS